MEETERQLVLDIQNGGDLRSKALKTIYYKSEIKKTIAKHILQTGGQESDIDDIYQDTIVLFDKNIRNGKFKGQSSLTTYIIGIAKWRWWSIRRKKDKHLAPLEKDAEKMVEKGPDVVFIENEKKEILEKAINLLGAKCQDILRYYRLNYSMQEISEFIGLSSPEMAKKEAYRCRIRLKKIFDQNPFFQQVLNDNR